MEIKTSNASQIGASQVSEQTKLQKKSANENLEAASKESVSSSGDKIEISAEASLLSKGIEAAKNSPDIRAEKVAELKKAIQSGTYKVDAKNIADKMINSSIEESILLSRKR